MTRLNVLFFSWLILSSCSSVSQQDQEDGLISAEELKSRIEEGLDGALIDLRTPAEVSKGVIPGSIVIDYRADDFATQIQALAKDKKYYLYCHSGGRSARAKDLMEKQGFQSIFDYGGGFKEWNSLGYPLVNASD